MRDRPKKLSRLGWGPRRSGSTLQAPGEVRNITIVGEGDTWAILRWRSPVNGGAPTFLPDPAGGRSLGGRGDRDHHRAADEQPAARRGASVPGARREQGGDRAAQHHRDAGVVTGGWRFTARAARWLPWERRAHGGPRDTQVLGPIPRPPVRIRARGLSSVKGRRGRHGGVRGASRLPPRRHDARLTLERYLRQPQSEESPGDALRGAERCPTWSSRCPNSGLATWGPSSIMGRSSRSISATNVRVTPDGGEKRGGPTEIITFLTVSRLLRWVRRRLSHRGAKLEERVRRPRIPRRDQAELLGAQECWVCLQLEDPQRAFETQQLAMLVGHAAYAICARCGQEAPDGEDRAYRRRVRRFAKGERARG